MPKFIVNYTSMVIDADTADEAIARAEGSSGGHWEAVPYCRDPEHTHLQAEATRLRTIIKQAYSNQGWDIGTVKRILLPGLEGYEHLTPEEPKVLYFHANNWMLGFGEGSSEQAWWLELELYHVDDDTTDEPIVKSVLVLADDEAMILSARLDEKVREARRDWS